MPTGVTLYKSRLFDRSYKSTVIQRLNNAPIGSHRVGDGRGVDSDAATRLGGTSIWDGTKAVGNQKTDKHGNFRSQGICCGITAGWVAAFLGGNSAATDHEEFEEFFKGPLRFQGTYAKDFKGNSSTINILLAKFKLKSSNPSNDHLVLTPASIDKNLPTDNFWVGYIGAYAHAIGIGYKDYRYYIMEPNGGLFEYQNRKKFLSDLKDFLMARFNSKNLNDDPMMKVYLYR